LISVYGGFGLTEINVDSACDVADLPQINIDFACAEVFSWEINIDFACRRSVHGKSTLILLAGGRFMCDQC